MLPVKWTHLERLTDDTGLKEHAVGKIARRNEGYACDDNARALWAVIEWMGYGRAQPDQRPVAALSRLADRYLEFILWVQGDDGWFHNNVAFDRSFEPEVPSDDCQGRTLFALTMGLLHDPDPGREAAYRWSWPRALAASARIRSLRGMAHALAAVSRVLLDDPGRIDAAERRRAELLASKFMGAFKAAYRDQSRSGWRWFEPRLTYANGVLPWAVWEAHLAFGDAELARIGTESLEFLIERMTAPTGCLRPIGNRGWASPHGSAQWDQQPLEMMKLALAAAAAYQATATSGYGEVISRCRGWYRGENDLGVGLVDPVDGGVADALTPEGPSQNQGAEATLSFLITEALAYCHLPEPRPALTI